MVMSFDRQSFFLQLIAPLLGSSALFFGGISGVGGGGRMPKNTRNGTPAVDPQRQKFNDILNVLDRFQSPLPVACAPLPLSV